MFILYRLSSLLVSAPDLFNVIKLYKIGTLKSWKGPENDTDQYMSNIMFREISERELFLVITEMIPKLKTRQSGKAPSESSVGGQGGGASGKGGGGGGGGGASSKKKKGKRK